MIAVCVIPSAWIVLEYLRSIAFTGMSWNLITASPREKYGQGQEIVIPEMNVSGFLVEAVKIDTADIVPIAPVGYDASASG